MVNTYTTNLTIKQVARETLFNGAYWIVTIKDNLDKANTRIKQVLKKNGYQESIINKICKRITNNQSLPLANQVTTIIQKEGVRTSINLPYIEVLVKNYDV